MKKIKIIEKFHRLYLLDRLHLLNTYLHTKSGEIHETFQFHHIVHPVILLFEIKPTLSKIPQAHPNRLRNFFQPRLFQILNNRKDGLALQILEL